jgi:hypothetical protein
LPRTGRDLVGDHINGNTLDNRRCNLRVVTAAGNRQNRRVRRDAPSPYRGAIRDAENRWRASVTIEGRRIRFGSFSTAEEAGAAASAYRRQHMPLSQEAA